MICRIFSVVTVAVIISDNTVLFQFLESMRILWSSSFA